MQQVLSTILGSTVVAAVIGYVIYRSIYILGFKKIEICILTTMI